MDRPYVYLLSFTKPTEDSGFENALDLVEYSGRVDYGQKSLNKMGERDIIRRWIESGHQSMIEMADATFLIECSRVVSHELVRHRHASFQQESQRYVKYDEENEEDLFFIPPEIAENPEADRIYREHLTGSLVTYKRLKDMGLKSQIARYALPNATRTRIVMKSNLRDWRHFCMLRMHSSAQPEMQHVARQIYKELNDMYPEVFGDIAQRLEEGERQVR
jgi:thymidylate synthase (FAD)